MIFLKGLYILFSVMIFLITYILVFVVFIILDKNFLGNMNITVIWCFICIQACAPVDMDFPGSIEEFFKKDEFASMCDLEKQSYSNLRMNYEMLLHSGRYH